MKFVLLLISITLIADVTFASRGSKCLRKCVRGESRTCEYDFRVETYYSMDAMACYNCPQNKTDCLRQDCIVGGGIKRNLVVINRQLPGPIIEVCLNDTVVVNFENAIMNDESSTIHWHGQLQADNPYMDGVPFVTQCPVLTNNNFTYTVRASVAGSHFWHSHEKMQRGDGMFGMFIVHVPHDENPHAGLYDKDIHRISITDWTIKPRIDVYGDFVHGGSLPAPDGILINGNGYMNLEFINPNITLTTVEVEQGKRYRMRFVNAEFFDCPFTVSIDNHTFTVISGDGHDVRPQAVNFFNIFAGERYDVILEANASIDTYWIRVKGLEMCELRGLFQVALLKYRNSTNEFSLADFPTYETAAPSSGLMFNPLLGDEPGTLLVNQLKSLDPMSEDYATPDVIRQYIKLSFNPVENPTSYRYPYYGFTQVAPNLRIVTPEMNDIGYQDSRIPLLPGRNELSESEFCNNETAYARQNCRQVYCHCTHVVNLPMNRIVELIVFDDGGRAAHHPMHLHGYNFRVVAWRRLGNTTSRAEIEELDRRGQIERNFYDAVRRDTIPVPRGGYAILRFKTDNPGYWMFHCHVDIHAEDGMRMVFKVGENRNMKHVPRDFPTCYGYPRRRNPPR